MNPKRDIHNADVDRLFQALDASERDGLREVWALAGDASVVPESARSLAWDKLDASLAAATPKARFMARPVRMVALLRTPVRLPALRLVSRMSVAASIILFLGLSYSLRPSASVYSSGAGQTDTPISLRDGSTVILAAGTVLRVSDSFGANNRSVNLDGEAFFEITPSGENAGLPFQVATFNADVTVLGTAFNVRARKSEWESATTVAVAHGTVRMASSELPDMAVVLKPGEGSSIEAVGTPSVPVQIDLERSTAWRNGGLAFSEEPMGAVFDELERRYDLEIQASPAIRSVLVSYWRESNVGVDEMLADLADVVDVNFRRTSSGYRLFESD